jgi:hypothetical protein
MNKKILMALLMGLVFIGGVSAGIGYKELMVDNLFVGNHLRSDGTLHINGNLFVDDLEGWTGNCEYTPVFRDGIMIDCIGGDKNE